MLSKQTIDVLNSIATISADDKSNKITISYPLTFIVAPAGDILVQYDLRNSEIGEFENIPVYNLNNLLSVFKLFGDDRTVVRDNKLLKISDGTAAGEYIISDESLVEYKDYSKIFESTVNAPSIATFVMSKDSMKNLRNASGVFKDLDEYLLETSESGVKVSLAATNSFKAASNTYSNSFLAKTEKEFTVKLPVKNLNMLPVSDYQFDIKYNSAQDKYRIILTSTEMDNFKIILSPSVK